jgi:hypothetical protein
MGMLSRLAARHAAARNGVNLDGPEWVATVFTPQSEEPIRPQIHGPSPRPCCPAEARATSVTHADYCGSDLLPERYPIAGLPPIRTEGRDHR